MSAASPTNLPTILVTDLISPKYIDLVFIFRDEDPFQAARPIGSTFVRLLRLANLAPAYGLFVCILILPAFVR